MPRAGLLLGLVGTNGTGKSTALKILSNNLKPNFGDFAHPPSWDDIITHYRGSSLQHYFLKMVEGKLITVMKPQNVYLLPKALTGSVRNVGKLLKGADETGSLDRIVEALGKD